MAVAVASMVLSNAPGQAQTAAPAISSFLFFTGTDLWRYGDFFYGGALWSPAGHNSDGFTVKLLLNGAATATIPATCIPMSTARWGPAL
jgi:hypothetical protein